MRVIKMCLSTSYTIQCTSLLSIFAAVYTHITQNLKAGLLFSGNLSASLEDKKHLWKLTTTKNHGNLDTNLIILVIFMLFCPN